MLQSHSQLQSQNGGSYQGSKLVTGTWIVPWTPGTWTTYKLSQSLQLYYFTFHSLASWYRQFAWDLRKQIPWAWRKNLGLRYGPESSPRINLQALPFSEGAEWVRRREGGKGRNPSLTNCLSVKGQSNPKLQILTNLEENARHQVCPLTPQLELMLLCTVLMITGMRQAVLRNLALVNSSPYPHNR